MTAYYSDDSVTLHLGDCREVLPTLDIKPDCCITDPPYGETSLAWDRWPDGWPAAVAGVTSSLWCFGTLRMFMARATDLAAWNLSHDVVWRKHNASGPNADRFRRIHEQVAHFYRGRWSDVFRCPQRITTGIVELGRVVGQGAKAIGQRGAYRGSSWSDDGSRLMTSVIDARSMHRIGGAHPCEKPVVILDPLIRYACPEDGLVLDVFAGSGSTAEAARLCGRRTVLIEADERYCEAIALRMQRDVLPLG